VDFWVKVAVAVPRVGFAPFPKAKPRCWSGVDGRTGLEGRAGWHLGGQQQSRAWGWAGCHFWGGLGGSAVLADTTRCLSAFAQRLCHGCCWEPCAGDAGAESTPCRFWLLKRPRRSVGKGWFCFLPFLFFISRSSITVVFLFLELGLAGFDRKGIWWGKRGTV